MQKRGFFGWKKEGKNNKETKKRRKYLDLRRGQDENLVKRNGPSPKRLR